MKRVQVRVQELEKINNKKSNAGGWNVKNHDVNDDDSDCDDYERRRRRRSK